MFMLFLLDDCIWMIRLGYEEAFRVDLKHLGAICALSSLDMNKPPRLMNEYLVRSARDWFVHRCWMNEWNISDAETWSFFVCAIDRSGDDSSRGLSRAITVLTTNYVDPCSLKLPWKLPR